MADYLIVGGGLAGCVLASRLLEYDPTLDIAIIEAGPNEHKHPLITEPLGTMQLNNSRFQYNYKTVPQKHYDGRQVFQAGGKLLSGSSAVNYAAWTRGDRADYDQWGKMVNDERWTYDGLLPYFCRTETHHDPEADPDQHGFDGVNPIRDHNSGDNKGMAPHVENWYRGKRQPAGKAYLLEGIQLLTNQTVERIILESRLGRFKATGIGLTSGQELRAFKEVIVCCGAIRTPQLLMLSGIGPAEELEKLNIPLFVESPDLGKNFSDHSSITQFYRIRNPEKGLCAPSAAFNHPSYVEGFPTDYIIAESAPTSALKQALQLDSPEPEKSVISDTDPYLFPPRTHYEILPMYAPTEVPLTDMNIPLDGSIISIGIIGLLPTSRGSVTLASRDPMAHPLIDPNYYATHVDRVVLRAGMRRNMAAFETPEAQAVVAEEVPPAGFPALNSKSTDDELDARIKKCAGTFYHTSGTASMGRVVDTECKVKGVTRLRVVDASVLPTPISAHYMVAVYALAEQMAEIIVSNQRP